MACCFQFANDTVFIPISLAIWQEALESQVYDSMKSLVEKMLGIQIGKSEESGTETERMSVEELAEALGIGTTPETAAAIISEDGMWGVDASGGVSSFSQSVSVVVSETTIAF